FDVGLRTITRHAAVRPAIVEFDWLVPSGVARTLSGLVMNLLPGTLMVEDAGSCVHVHVIDAGGSFRQEIVELQRRVAALFGIDATEQAQ
ncbi:MAG: hypothetical protein GTN60_06785, partial [Pseudomonas stutzeri]|nr:hypothetical protein [Stutzerimonas stutzeri]NIN81128.1 hypothetical protein [Stutzerimonas stutzeri]NIP00372.1 hypothetical protein [Stutzerimonas stutzeri]NIS57151.1 hypothetical protein [Stutzerimonas stutzeri]